MGANTPDTLPPNLPRDPEQGKRVQDKLDEALALLQKCLKLDPSDDRCQHEVEYVNGLKSKKD